MALGTTLTTAVVSSITKHTAVGGGEIIALNGDINAERGLVYALTPNPTTITGTKIIDSGTGVGTFVSNITGLVPGTIYYTAAYAISSLAQNKYGADESFTTQAGQVPILTTETVFTIGKTTAIGRGHVSNDQGQLVTERGIYWDYTNDPVGVGTKIIGPGTGEGSFEVPITGLTPNTLVYVCAYAINADGTGYGTVKSFTTAAATIPTIETREPLSPVFYTVTSGGTIINDGADTLIATGIVWDITPNPTLSDNVVTQGGDNYQPFSLSFLSDPNEKYYIRAYATNGIGTGYGPQVTIQSEPLDMKPQRIEKISVVKVVPFTTKVLFDNSLSISQAWVTNSTDFTPETIGALPGNKALCRLIGDGINTPTFSGFKAMTNSVAYDPTSFNINLVEFLFDGIDYWYNILSGGLPS